MSLEVLFHDRDYIVVQKPAGLLVHRTQLDKNESQSVVQLLHEQLKEKVFPVHRLDKPTSGVLVLAKSSEAAQKLSQEFVDQKVKKKYWAIVRGRFKDEIYLDYPLRLEIKKDKYQKLQSAQTFFTSLASVEIDAVIDRYPKSRFSLVQAIPVTGRTHQIRRHLKHLRHPIIGDVNHGDGKQNKYFSKVLGIKGLMLACVEMSFTHPNTLKELVLKADLPLEFKKVAESLGLPYGT